MYSSKPEKTKQLVIFQKVFLTKVVSFWIVSGKYDLLQRNYKVNKMIFYRFDGFQLSFRTFEVMVT
jgi:hypothetical protein